MKALTVLFSCFFLISSGFSQENDSIFIENTGIIKGQLMVKSTDEDPEITPYDYGVIQLLKKNRLIMLAISDDDGFYTFDKIEAGTYQIYIPKAPHLLKSIELKVTVESQKTTIVENLVVETDPYFAIRCFPSAHQATSDATNRILFPHAIRRPRSPSGTFIIEREDIQNGF